MIWHQAGVNPLSEPMMISNPEDLNSDTKYSLTKLHSRFWKRLLESCGLPFLQTVCLNKILKYGHEVFRATFLFLTLRWMPHVLYDCCWFIANYSHSFITPMLPLQYNDLVIQIFVALLHGNSNWAFQLGTLAQWRMVITHVLKRSVQLQPKFSKDKFLYWTHNTLF